MVIVGVARHYGPEYHFQVYGTDWISGLTKIVGELRAITPHVVVFGATPKPDQDVPGCLSEHLTDVGACVQSRAGSLNAIGSLAERTAVAQAGGRYLPVASMALHALAVPGRRGQSPRVPRRQPPHDDDHRLAGAARRRRARRRPARRTGDRRLTAELGSSGRRF